MSLHVHYHHYDKHRMFDEHEKFPYLFVENIDTVDHYDYFAVTRAWTAALEWCKAEFGVEEERWTGNISSQGLNYLSFRNEKDAFLFRLRWC